MQTNWPLKGVAMGNPWLDTPALFDSYLPFSLERGLMTAQVASSIYPSIQQVTRRCCRRCRSACRAGRWHRAVRP